MKDIKPKKQCLVILIVTRNNPSKLKNLLYSVNYNQFLSDANICIIDDSNINKDIVENKKIVQDLKNNKILLINKDTWGYIKLILSKKVKIKRYQFILKDLKLGEKYWNTHNTRNIGQIICSLFYRDNNIILSLDGDMIIPKKFYFNKNKVNTPLGIVLSGCPDLSRLEWIKLYIRYIAKWQYKKNLNGNREYSSFLIDKLSESDTRYILSNYSTLLNDKITLDKKIFLPTREELNNGAYLTNLENITKTMYPSWFDSDWFCFQRLRKQIYYPVKFNNSEIIHDSSKKNPLDKKLLIFEEIGKIITTVLQDQCCGYIPNKTELLKEIKRREKIINNEIMLLKTLKSNLDNNREIIKISKIIISLQELIKSIKSINLQELINQIKKYESKEKDWNFFLNFLKKSNIIKRNVHNKLNYKKIVIFSPHCDDVIFSLGGAINEGYLINLEVYDVYTKSNYQLGSKKHRNITKLRSIEECKALNKFDIFPIFLGYNDATKREYVSEKHYMSFKNNPRKDSSFISIQKKIREIIKKDKTTIFLFPLGLGYNIDHVILSEIGKELDKEGYSILFYEDMGYDTSLSNLLIKKYLKDKKISLTSKTFRIYDVLGKLDSMRVYKTQISKKILEDIRNIIKNRGGERLWGREKNFALLDW
jgi:LmbE family N-acetylglucosaminyl deacetylase